MIKNKVNILAFGVHPDDVECSAAGVVLKHISIGKTVAIVDLTAGEMGNYGTAEDRKEEADASAKILGISYRDQLGMPDGGVENTEENRMMIIHSIRKYQPEIVICNAIHDRHPDHANAAKLVADACFLSGLKKKTTYENGNIQQAWRPNAVYHYIQDYMIQPDIVIDISDFIEKKIEAILAFRSQFVSPENRDPNSIMGLLNHIKNTNSIFGRPINAAYAEGFTVNRYIGVSDFYKLI